MFNNKVIIFIIELKAFKDYKDIALLFNNLNFEVFIIIIEKDNKVFIFIKVA